MVDLKDLDPPENEPSVGEDTVAVAETAVEPLVTKASGASGSLESEVGISRVSVSARSNTRVVRPLLPMDRSIYNNARGKLGVI